MSTYQKKLSKKNSYPSLSLSLILFLRHRPIALQPPPPSRLPLDAASSAPPLLSCCTPPTQRLTTLPLPRHCILLLHPPPTLFGASTARPLAAASMSTSPPRQLSPQPPRPRQCTNTSILAKKSMAFAKALAPLLVRGMLLGSPPPETAPPPAVAPPPVRPDDNNGDPREGGREEGGRGQPSSRKRSISLSWDIAASPGGGREHRADSTISVCRSPARLPRRRPPRPPPPFLRLDTAAPTGAVPARGNFQCWRCRNSGGRAHPLLLYSANRPNHQF